MARGMLDCVEDAPTVAIRPAMTASATASTSLLTDPLTKATSGSTPPGLSGLNGATMAIAVFMLSIALFVQGLPRVDVDHPRKNPQDDCLKGFKLRARTPA